MVGRAGPTIVWSRAPRNRPSMTAKRISIFARWLSPSAGSSSRVGVIPSWDAGKLSMMVGSSLLQGRLVPGGGLGRPVGLDVDGGARSSCACGQFVQILCADASLARPAGERVGVAALGERVVTRVVGQRGADRLAEIRGGGEEPVELLGVETPDRAQHDLA